MGILVIAASHCGKKIKVRYKMETIFSRRVIIADVKNAQMTNNKTISVITDAGVGGTFLSWSIMYLSGQNNYFNKKTNKWLQLTENPITKDRNAHNFLPNFETQLDDLCQLIDTLKNTNSKYPHVLYYHELHPQNPAEAIEFLIQNNNKNIIVSMDKHYGLYMCNMSNRAGAIPSFTEPKYFLTDDNEILNNFMECYFSDSKEFFDLNNIWDKREFIALNYDLVKCKLQPITAFLNDVEKNQNYFRLNCFDLYCAFETTVYTLFKYLDLELDANRYTLWLNTYQKWKKFHYNRLRFIWYLDEIVEDILYNRPRNLIDFELDLLQEAMIQQKLLTYNLNLQNWQLDKFRNTQQLHKLLEPNIHD